MNPFARSALASGFAASVALFGARAHAETKVAVVDVQRAVMQTEDGLRAQAQLKKLFDSRQQELNRKQKDMAKQKDDIDRQAKVLSQDALQKRVTDYQKQLEALQGMFMEYNKELEKTQKEMTEPIFERVLGAIKRVAGSDGFDLVFDKQTVAFARSDLDLTDRVIQIANSGGGAPAKAGTAPATGTTPSPAPAPVPTK